MKDGPRNYAVKKNGCGYWQTTPRMRALGFEGQPCGRDGARARSRAEQYNREWDRERQRARKGARTFTLDMAAFARDYASKLEPNSEPSDFFPAPAPRQPRQSAPTVPVILSGVDVGLV
jgi:hypothetical protein